MQIKDILVGERHRKDMGDLQALADSIEDIGLLHPVGVTGRGELVFGERRLRACRDILKWKEVPVRIVNVRAIVEGEYHENELRKDFTPSERVAIAKEIERQIGNRQGQRNDRKPVGKIPQVEPGKKTREVAAEKAGFGNDKTYRQAALVVEKGSPSLVEAMDAGKVAVSTAAVIAEAPKQVQEEIVAKGKDEIIAKAKELQRERREQDSSKRTAQPNGKNPHREAHEDAARRWADSIHRIFVIITSIRDAGGIESLTKQWSADARKNFLGQLKRIDQQIKGWIGFLEGEAK